MVFSSTIFIMLFLPLFLMAYYAVPNKYRSHIILLGSYIFYAWWRVDFLLLFFGVTLFNHIVSKQMVSKAHLKKKFMILGVVGNILTLGYFKYFNFGVDSLNNLLGYAGQEHMTLWSVILPIGISFYIFQAISYIIDVYRGDANPPKRFVDFAAFIALFPQLIAGPVLRYKDVVDQFTNRTHTWEKFNEGATRFSIGFCKKIFIADTLAPLADASFALQDPTMVEAWVGILAYTAQLYFDFSGYSDMAIGLGLMMGFRFIENFNHPYTSRSITEFWKRWHISLSTWLRDYLYIPLGGNRKGNIRTYINLIITMVLGGLWHGANWTFVAWGALHGTIMAFERYMGSKNKKTPYPQLLALPITFLFVIIGWVFFRSETIAKALGMLKSMAGMNGIGFSNEILWSITNLQISVLVFAYIIIFTSPFIVGQKKQITINQSWASSLSAGHKIMFMGLMVLGLFKLISSSFSPFLYFQF